MSIRGIGGPADPRFTQRVQPVQPVERPARPQERPKGPGERVEDIQTLLGNAERELQELKSHPPVTEKDHEQAIAMLEILSARITAVCENAQPHEYGLTYVAFSRQTPIREQIASLNRSLQVAKTRPALRKLVDFLWAASERAVRADLRKSL